MNKIFLVTIATICYLPMTDGSASEPRRDVKYDFNVESTGKIYFQPQVPDDPKEGEIWIDAKNGDRFFYYEGVWVSKDYRITITKPEPKKKKSSMRMRRENTSSSLPTILTTPQIQKASI
ncbi:MAG: hypothetical protein GXP04_01195 [Alphaproteobacteria bacterium]|nr:hypothetical protein [Alphaproteobacteria bacterium]